MKTLAIKTPKIVQRVKAEYGYDLSQLNVKGALKDPNNVYKLHVLIGDELGLPDKKKQAAFASMVSADPNRKPNVIFDVTLKSMSQLQKYTLPLQQLGYDKENIHIVWVVNDIEVAKKQNMSRNRQVPVEILVDTHRGTSSTMKSIVSMGETLSYYMDGEIVFAFNKVGVDTDFVKSGKGGGYIKDANYVYIKRAGKKVDRSQITKDITRKLSTYVPKDVEWEDI